MAVYRQRSLKIFIQWFPLINKPTRVTKHFATLIDKICSNYPLQERGGVTGILNISISDHYGFCITDHTVTN